VFYFGLIIMYWINRVLQFRFRSERNLPIARVLRVSVGAIAVLAVTAAFADQSPEDLLSAGRVDEAVQALQRQIEISPSAESYNLLCRAQYQLAAWDAGIPACEKATQLAPTNGLFHLWLGRIYGEKADHASFLSAIGLAKKVRVEFERAVQFAPSSWESRTDLAEFYAEAPGIVGGGENKARAQAQQIAPLNLAMAHWVNGRLAEKDKDVAAAEREYQAAVQASHGGARAWLNLAGFYSRYKRFDDMDRALRGLQSSSLDHPDALVDGAGIVIRTGRNYPLAVFLLRRYLGSSTVEAAPAFKAHAMLGEVLEKQGDSAGAANEYRAALALAHSYRAAQDGLDRVNHQSEVAVVRTSS
jgi:tetratricopeptide (TPR) repeat protein